MSQLTQLMAIEDLKHQLTTLQDELMHNLIDLRLVQKFIQDVPQFERGVPLPDVIKPEHIDVQISDILKACIEPQSVFQYQHNLPKRFAGIIQYQASRAQYDEVMKMVGGINDCRQKIIKLVISVEPSSRKRAALTKRLFPDILYQTLCRNISLAPHATHNIQFSWYEHGKGLKKLSTENAEAMVQHFNAAAPTWQALRNLQSLHDAPNAFKVTNVRVHPQAVINYIEDEYGKNTFETRKVHSPIIALVDNDSPIKIEHLPEYRSNHSDREHTILKDYRPIIEGTNLVYRA